MTDERPETRRRHKDDSLQKQRWFIDNGSEQTIEALQKQRCFIDNGSEQTIEALKQHAKRARDFGVGRK